VRIPRRFRTPAVIGLSLLAGLACAVWSLYSISVLPPSLHARQLKIGAASTAIEIDAPKSLIASSESLGSDFDAYEKRGVLYSNLLASDPVVALVARRMGISGDQIAVRSRLTSGVQWAMRDPDLEQRASQIRVAQRPFKLEMQADPDIPVLHIYAQAPSAALAVKLADAGVAGLGEYLHSTAVKDGTGDEVALNQLGAARGAPINGQTQGEMVVLSFLVGFGLALGAFVFASRIRRGWRGAAPVAAEEEPVPAVPAAHFDAVAHSSAREPRLPGPLKRVRERAVAGAGGDWPRTTRVMPWMIAGFMAVLWTVPFNVIQLSVSLPFDLKFDRMILPLLFIVWILSLAVGGPASPKLRMTLIHGGIAGFVAVVCIGIVLNQHDLNQTLEFDLAFKKLTLLLSYTMLFLIIASSVRKREVHAYMKYTLYLSLVCALGTIWEYRFHYNVFYDLSSKLLPGIFTVGSISTDTVDDIGRAMTYGPSDHPLEVTGMITMALPIALVGITHSKERRARMLYALAACVLLAAAISTYRKSALLGPLAVVLTIAYFRRRELLRLAPLGAVSLGVIHALSPGALGSIVSQLHPSKLGVGTVSDRSSDYDAVRPDFWSHLAFGRGYGSYDHLSYRVLDSEILSRLVDTGIIGELSFALMLLSIVLAARGVIRGRHPLWGPPALAVASSAVAFFVLAFLFDVTSFPHVPYILLSLAGLVAVAVQPDEPDDGQEPQTPRVRSRHAARTHTPVRRAPRRQQV
jgi:hypothetical protein